jgi:cyanophycinase
MCPSPDIKGVSRGYVIPIGGAEEKVDSPRILQRFVDLCGCSEARIVVIPTASLLEDTGPAYVELFESLGVQDVINLPIESRADGDNEKFVGQLKGATGIFITGGNQLRLSTILGGTEIAQSIRRLNAIGVHVAGTSAGAAIMSQHMITGGSHGSKPTEDGVMLAPGLGLTNDVVIDQHFTQRDRLGRLLSALSYNPFASGIGLDEDTAAFIAPDGELEVVGSGVVTIIDPGRLQHSTMGAVGTGDPVSLVGLILHILADGCTYNTKTRCAVVKYDATTTRG